MADNISAPAAGTTFATDDLSGVHYPRNKIGEGADGEYRDIHPANPLPVRGTTKVVSASFNRPANSTAYAVGDLVANNATAGSVVVPEFTVARAIAAPGAIRRVRLSSNRTSGIAGTEVFTVHLFTIAPTLSQGDNGVFASGVAGRAAGYIGSVDVVLSRLFSDGASGIGVPRAGNEILFQCESASQKLFALIETRQAYTPASGETFAITLEALLD